jgi:DNA-binding LacI/PurR family transcriptional regulator
MAVAAINVLHEHGRRVPQDVAVVGYDDLSIAKFNSPPLTTISQKIPLVGKMLAQNLIQNIETGVVTNVTLPAELVIRKSA